ncbi:MULTISPECIES: PRC-barrel domain-containing protein [Rhodomicrobium]|uniref:PRC-barrel domain-containing protein n=1 Tax=Rhodomicrobium TaxID=1068 RepID=UPI001FD9EF1C|nr:MULTISPECIES: PRC-barrel domain-containing protein [Rhodomicrobium]
MTRLSNSQAAATALGSFRPFAGARLRVGAALIVAAMCSGVLTTQPHPASAQGVQLLQLDVKVIAKGYRASSLIGKEVRNDKNEKIGSLDEIIIDKKQVLFAIIQVGGFLGVGGRLVAVGYDQLQIDDLGNKITLPGASKEQLEKLDEFRYQTS